MTTDEMLMEAFSIYGTVTDAKVMRERDTFKSRGFGFVTYADPNGANTCVASNVICDGRQIDVKLAQSKEEMEEKKIRAYQEPEAMKPALGAITSGKIFVGGLSQATNQDSLLAAMQPYGEISEVMVMFDKITEKSRGFGFVTFVDPNSVSHLMATPNMEVDGKIVEIKPAQEKTESPHAAQVNPGSTKIFVGGLAAVTTDASLQQYFAAFGQVSETSVMYDKETSKSRGFAFVEFERYDGVSAALSQNNHQIDGKWVDCKIATPETPRTVMQPGAGVGKGAPFGAKGFGKGGKNGFVGFAAHRPMVAHHQVPYQHRPQPY